jgi:hypothetical protein
MVMAMKIAEVAAAVHHENGFGRQSRQPQEVQVLQRAFIKDFGAKPMLEDHLLAQPNEMIAGVCIAGPIE